MYSLAGEILLSILKNKVFGPLTTPQLEDLLESVFDELSKLNRNYNKIFNNNPILIKEVFMEEEILEEIALFLTNKGKLKENSKIINLIKQKVDIKKDYINELLGDFQDKLILTIIKNPLIKDEFIVTTLFDMNQTQKEVFKAVIDEMRIVGEEETGRFIDYGAITQFRILAHDFENFIEEIKKHTRIKNPNRFIRFKKKSKDFYVGIYQNRFSNRTLNIEDSPFKIVYPNIHRVKIWFKKKKIGKVKAIEISVFLATPLILNRLGSIFISCLPAINHFQKGNFHKKMKKFVMEAYPHSVCAIKFDPDIIQELKLDRMPSDIRVKEEMLSGDAGMLHLKEIKTILSKIREFNSNGEAMILFFKASQDKTFIKGKQATFMISSDGNVSAYFKKEEFPNEDKKFESLYKWYLGHADFNFIKPRSKKFNLM